MKDYFNAPPGVLAGQQIGQLKTDGKIIVPDSVSFKPDESAIDLPITAKAWVIPHGLRPTKQELDRIKAGGLHEPVEGVLTFERGKKYLVELAYDFHLPENVSGRATGRSSVGRLDVITRLIADDCSEYDLVPPGYKGKLHLLVLSQTFKVQVRVGHSLNQLRLFCGSHFDAIISRESVRHYGTPFWFVRRDAYVQWPLEETDHEREARASLIEDPYQVDLTVDLADPEERHIFKARIDQSAAVRLRKGANNPTEYFDPESIEGDAVTLEQNRFYILKSRERLHIPSTVAVEVIAISERIGDIRIHYAGFAHPEFGLVRKDKKRGTPLIFEVRSTDMSTQLKHEALLARVQLFRMSQPYDRGKTEPFVVSVPDEWSEAEPGQEGQSDYGNQELQLSNYFRPWPRSS